MNFLSLFQKKNRPPQPTSAPPRLLSYECAGIQGIGSRDRQEDAYILVNADDVTQILRCGLLAVVADGMGGMQGGEEASHGAVQVIRADFLEMDRCLPLEPQLLQSLQHANQWVYQRLGGTGGSTVIACVLFQQHLFYAGVGDSYLYLLRKGQLTRINREQNVLHQRYLELIRRKCPNPMPADATPEQQAITSFLGMDVLEDVDWFRQAMPLLDGDVLLLCSDGVGNMLSRSELICCLEAGSANDICLALQQRVKAKKYPGQDNYTAVVIRCEK